jgi:hypothetical protein
MAVEAAIHADILMNFVEQTPASTLRPWSIIRMDNLLGTSKSRCARSFKRVTVGCSTTKLAASRRVQRY